MSDDKINKEELKQEMVKWIPTKSKGRYDKLIDKLLSGTVMAAIRLKCLDCQYFQEKEIRNCSIKSCPLWPFRMRRNPFRKKRTDNKNVVPPWVKTEKEDNNE